MRFLVFKGFRNNKYEEVVVTLKALVLEVTSMKKSSKCTVTCLRWNDIVQ